MRSPQVELGVYCRPQSPCARERRISLNEILDALVIEKIAVPEAAEKLRADALVSAELNFREVDKAPEDVLNRILWRALKGTGIPFPEWAAGIEDEEEEERERAAEKDDDDEK